MNQKALKMNCWEFKKCGREPGGSKVNELGVCPAATFKDADGFLGGKNGGKACAYITGTFCNQQIQGTFKDKMKECLKCDFYKELMFKHGTEFTVLKFSEYVMANQRIIHQ